MENKSILLDDVYIHDAKIHSIMYIEDQIKLIISPFKGNSNPYPSKMELKFFEVKSFSIKYGDVIGFEWCVLDISVKKEQESDYIETEILVSDMSTISIVCKQIESSK